VNADSRVDIEERMRLLLDYNGTTRGPVKGHEVRWVTVYRVRAKCGVREDVSLCTRLVS
jgi:hypothetical protein